MHFVQAKIGLDVCARGVEVMGGEDEVNNDSARLLFKVTCGPVQYVVVRLVKVKSRDIQMCEQNTSTQNKRVIQ